LLWLIAPLVLIFIFASIFPGLHSAWRTRYLYSMSLALLLLAARGYCVLQTSLAKYSVGVLFLLLTGMALVDHDRTLNRQQIRQTCDYVKQNLAKGDVIAIGPSHYRNLVPSYYMKWYHDTVEPLPELVNNTTQGGQQYFMHALDGILKMQKRTWILFFLDQDERRDCDLSAALSRTRKTLDQDWHIITDRPYVSFTRTFHTPYVGAHVMLVEPSVRDQGKVPD